MTNWKFTLDIHKVCSDKELSIQDKGKAVAKEIIEMVPEEWLNYVDPDNDLLDQELMNIIEWFLDMDSYHSHSIANEFDGIMECLYDWADQEIEPLGMRPPNKMCWIKTHYNM